VGHPSGGAIVTGHPLRRSGFLRAKLSPGGGFVTWLKPKP
jgi:hypothetical protein